MQTGGTANRERRSGIRFAERAGHLVFRSRDVLAPAALVAVVGLTRRQDFLAPPALDRSLDVVGIVAIGLGLAVRLWVMASSGIRRSGVHKRVVCPTLYTEGPYGRCRNPLYVANGIILVGLAAIFDSRWMAFAALPAALLALASIVAAEERVLAQTFGERYRQYRARVPRFVPRRRVQGRSSRPTDWRRALRKEYGTMFAATSTALALLAAKNLARFGSFGHRRGPVLLGTWLVLAGTWAALRHMKRTGRLNDRPATAAVDAEPGDVTA
jgi:protein-S-isoprenylcysteine O-methyltransferase Ste14